MIVVVIAASKAKQPMSGHDGKMDCFVASLLAMTIQSHTFSKGTSIWVRFSSHCGTGSFFERMKSGLNSFD
jgi:hypothetical protein